MKRNILITTCLLFFSSLIFAQQIENPGFEEWEEVGLGPNIIEPVNWSTIKTSDDPTLSGLAPVTWEKSTDSHSGQYSIKLFNLSALGIPVVGTVCNGQYHPNRNTDPAYSFTNTEDPQWNTPFTSRPDSIAFWMKFFPVGDDTLQFQALLHVNTCSLPPQPDNEENQVAYTRADLGGTYENWTRIALAFDYFDDRTPEYILIILTSGNGTASIEGSYAFYDDLEIIEHQSVNDNPYGNTNIYISSGTLYLNNFPNDYVKNARIEILDVTGHLLWQSKIYSTELSLNSFNVNKGFYIVRIISTEHIFSRKLYID